ncbi:ty3-gypsy retrotransposon protein [Tanacetum coccineum]
MTDEGDDSGQEPTTEEEEAVESGDISILNSLIGQGSPRSLQLWGKIGIGNVYVLIDNGSTHNFVRPVVVEQMRLPIQTTKAFMVYIGSGETLLCGNVCAWVNLQMQGLTMEVDLYVLPMHGPDVVLGDASLWMKRISLHQMQALWDAEDVYGVYEFHNLPLVAGDHGASKPRQPALEALLSRFAGLFQVPTVFPPHRLIDHRIHLLPNTKPVNVRPYRYPYYQKGEMEKLVKEMMSQGIIHFSHSPFSLPVLLVKNKDGSYHFCVDYRALNAITVKDKFLIPTADEMFDELGGAHIFPSLIYGLGNGVEMDPKKVATVREWPVPTSQQHVRGFLGLTGYYRRFIQGYAMAPFLGLPDFDQIFVVEADASGGDAVSTFREVMAKSQNILSLRVMVHLLMNEEIMEEEGFVGTGGFGEEEDNIEDVVVVANDLCSSMIQTTLNVDFEEDINTKSHELMSFGKSIIIKVIQTPLQQKYVCKLMGFDFSIEYKPGASNQVANVLSRMNEEVEQVTNAFMSLSQPLVWLMEDLKHENESLEELQQLHQKMDRGEIPIGFRRKNGLVIYRDRYYIGHESRLKTLLLREFQDTPSVGHGRIKKMLPLPTPTAVWEDVSMDFITGLPPSKGVTVILVIVDRLTKYAHFGVLPTSFNSPKVAELFLEIVVKHHGVPKTIVSDRDPIFVSNFRKQIFQLSGMKLNHSIAYHPQTDGQTEVVNQCLEQYLRAMVTDRPHHWVRLLPWAEYSYNTNYHSSIKMSPFQALYGRLPLSVIPYPPGSSKVAAVYELLVERDECLRQLKENLLVAQNRMETKANCGRREVEFNIGDKVLVKLQPYQQLTLARRLSNKLSKRYYGPYKVEARVGKVAYRLTLPHSSKIHPVFHVSILKPFLGNENEVAMGLPEDFQEGSPVEQPLAICDSRMMLRDGKLAWQVLVQWVGVSPEEATWEWLSEFQLAYPNYNIEDKVIFEDRGNVTSEVVEDERPKRVRKAPGWQTDFLMG